MTVDVPCMNICTSIEKNLYDLEMAVRRRKMQCSPKVLFLCVDISAVIKQQLRNVAISKSGCSHQRGPASLVSAIHVCAILDQYFGHLQLSYPRFHSQCSFVVCVPSIDV